MTKRTLSQQLLVLFGLLLLWGCSKDETDDTASVAFTFSHVWDALDINADNLTTVAVTNANGELMNFTRIRYLVSRFKLENTSTGATYVLQGYKFTDLALADSYHFTPESNTLPAGRYKLQFIWGFNEADNTDGAYTDLNSASWNWPAMLGGGYHFLQMDGSYNLNNNASPYNYHNGKARASIDPPVFEPNYQTIVFDESFEITGATTINIRMDISEFFEGPHLWNLNELDTPLMPNYTAQKMMQENVLSVFSIHEITNN